MQGRCIFLLQKKREGKVQSLPEQRRRQFLSLDHPATATLTPGAAASLVCSSHGKEQGCKTPKSTGRPVPWHFCPMPAHTQFNRRLRLEFPFHPTAMLHLSSRWHSAGLALLHVPSAWERRAGRGRARARNKIAVIRSVSQEWFICIPQSQGFCSRNFIEVFHSGLSQTPWT